MKKTMVVLALLFGKTWLLSQSSMYQLESLFSVIPDPVSESKDSPVKKATYLRLNELILKQLLLAAPESTTFALPISENRRVTFALYRSRNLLAPDFSVVTGEGEVYPYKPGLYYRGYIIGASPSVVTVSLFESEVMAIFSDKTGNYVLGLWNSSLNSDKTIYVLYEDRDWIAPRFYKCEAIGPDSKPEQKNGSSIMRNTLSNKCIRVYFECDYQMYLDRGSNVQNVGNFVTGMFNHVQTLYSNESINVTISQISVWTNTDPYQSYNQSMDILIAFKNNRTTFNGNIAHLLSTRNLNAGGIAYINVLCGSSNRHAYSNITNSYNAYPTYSWTVTVVTHEIGHNIGSAHTHRCNYWQTPGQIAIDACGAQAGVPEGTCSSVEGLPSNGGTIMSYCHLIPGVGINLSRGFGQLPGDTIRHYVNAATCLSTCSAAGCIASNSQGSLAAPTNDTEQLIANCTQAGQYNTITSVVSGQTYRFRSSNTSDFLTLTDASNDVLTSGTTPITWTASLSGTVRLHVHTNSSCGTSSTCRATYIKCTSCVAPACLSCPNHDFTLNPTSAWQTHTSSHPNNGCKVYKVSVVSGLTYSFKTGCGDGATADYDTYLELYNSSCNLITFDDDGCGAGPSIITWSATYTGDVYLRVRGYGGAGGNYTLAYQYQSAGCTASNGNGSISAPTDDVEQLIQNCTQAGQYNTITSVASGQTYRFRSSNTSDFLTLTDASNNVLTSGTTPISWTATFSGSVRLHVHTGSSCGTSSTCRNTYIKCTSCTPANPCLTCPNYDFTITPTPIWQTHVSSHPSNGCRIYKIPVTSGSTYTFKTGCGDGATADYDTYLELFSNSCNLLTADDDGCGLGPSIITWSANYTGDAYLKVRGFLGAGGNYTLAYQYGLGSSLNGFSLSPSIRIYPALSQEIVYIQVRQNLNTPIYITAYDMTGREIHASSFLPTYLLETYLRFTTSGVYLIKVSAQNIEHTERIIIAP